MAAPDQEAPPAPPAGAAEEEPGNPWWNPLTWLRAFRRADVATQYRPLPDLAPGETRGYRWTWIATMAVCTVLVAHMVFAFWAPAHPGVDQNGYLVGGRQFAYTGSTRFVPDTPYEYVGNMWVMTGLDSAGKAVYYPKYPLGLPILYAIPFWIGGEKSAGYYAFMVSPISSVLTFVGMFYLGRLVAGSFVGLLTAILLTTSQVMLSLMNNANSHASCTAFVVWGMFLLLRWWQTNAIWRGLLAGFLLGYACMIRYTEGLLILPIALACVCSMRWTQWRSYIRCAMPVIGWAVPVGYLLIFNLIAMGSLTGYDTTNESGFQKGNFFELFFTAKVGEAAFTWAKLTATWEQMLRTFHDCGSFFVLPLGIAGMALMFGRNVRAAFWILLWLVPGVVLYTSYYWSPERNVLSVGRFLTTFFPPILLGFAAAVRYGFFGGEGRSVVGPIVAGLLVAIAAGVGAYRAAEGLDDGRATTSMSLNGMHRQHASLAVSGSKLADLPDEAAVFSLDNGILNYGQFMGRYELYSTQAFSLAAIRTATARRDPDPNDPHPLQPARRDYLADFYAKMDQDRLTEERTKLIRDRIAKGKRVFVFASAASDGLAVDTVERTFNRRQYDTKVITRWRDQEEPRSMNWWAAVKQYVAGIKPAESDIIEPPATPDPRPTGGGFGGRRGFGGRAGAGGPGGGPPGGFGRGERTMSHVLVEIVPR